MTARGILSLCLFLSITVFAQQPATRKSPASSHKQTTAAVQPTDVEAAKVADIRRLLELTGTRDMVNQTKATMMAQFRKNAPGIPEDMFNEMMDELKADDLLESMIPVYSRHFTAADIKELIAFYQSPFGKKVLREMPQIIEESNDVGTQWGESVVTRVAKRWRDQGKISQRAYEQLMGMAGPEEEH